MARDADAGDELSLLIVVVNFRTPDLTIRALTSLVPALAELPGSRIAVVENGSADDSADRLAAAIEDHGWSEHVALLVSSRNLGFAGGVNLGFARSAPARYVLLLNSDAIVGPGVLRHCRDVLEGEPSVGAMSCLVLNADGSVQNVTRRFPTPLRLMANSLGLSWKLPGIFGWADVEDGTWDRRTTRRDVDWIGGAFLFLRGELIQRIGLLDANFFFLGEDIELGHRIHAAGFRSRYDPSVSVTHAGGGSSGDSVASRGWRGRQGWEARYRVLEKCHGPCAARSVRLVDTFAWTVRVAWRRWRRGATDPGTLEAREALTCIRGKSSAPPRP